MNGPPVSLCIGSGVTKKPLVLIQCSLTRFVLPALCSAVPVGRKALPVSAVSETRFFVESQDRVMLSWESLRPCECVGEPGSLSRSSLPFAIVQTEYT